MGANEELRSKLKFESANFIRRLFALIIDYFIIIIIWYLITKKDVDAMNSILSTLNPSDPESLEIFNEYLARVWTSFIIVWFVVQNAVFIIPPAIIGKGKTIGKLSLGLSMVDKSNLEEINPFRLILRETIARTIFETILVIPLLISSFMALIRADSRTLHDLISKTVVVRTSDLLED